VGDSIYVVVEQYVNDGVFEGGTIWDADLSTGLIKIGFGTEDMPQQVSPEIIAEAEALMEKIISGEIVVESTR